MKSYRLEGLDCANCAMKIEKGVQKINGVKEATVNFTSGKLTIDAEEDHLATIEQETKKVVKKKYLNMEMKKREIRCSGFYFPLQVSLYCYYLILMNQFA